MGVLNEQAKGRMKQFAMLGLRILWMFPLLAMFMTLGSDQNGFALQQATVISEGSGGGQPAPNVRRQILPQPYSVSKEAGGQALVHPALAVQEPAQQHAPEGAHGAAPVPQHGNEPAHASTGAQPSGAPPHGQEAPKGKEAPGAVHGAPAPPPAAGHEAGKTALEPPSEHGAGGAPGAHGPALPQISPTPGVTFVETMIELMDHELHGRFLGWRPNDLIIGRFTDDINNYQLGVLEALRFTALRLKDSLTRMGDADAYDPDLEQALNLLMNRSTLFWFPSAESSYGEAIEHWKNFVNKLKSGQRNFYYRKDNLILLLSSYRDLLGNVNRSLISSDVGWLKTDNAFYYAKGVAHVYYEILRVVRVGYHGPLTSTLNALDIMDEVTHELHRAEVMDPWLILDSDLDGFFANHRANLNAPLSEVAHLLVILSQF